MFDRLYARLKTAERKFRYSFGDDLSTPKARRQAWWHFQLMDHAFLRVWWTNFYPVSEGVYRSNHPSPARLQRYKSLGIKSVLNLRGNDGLAPWLLEEETCQKLGLNLHVVKIYARKAASREELIDLINIMRTIEKPFVLHCKSGADRAGLASAMYRIIFDGASVTEARKEFSFKYLHLKTTATGIVDHVLDLYEADHNATGITLEDWIHTKYDGDTLQASFEAKRAAAKS
jgi:protein tyrosine/serine phosphatase